MSGPPSPFYLGVQFNTSPFGLNGKSLDHCARKPQWACHLPHFSHLLSKTFLCWRVRSRPSDFLQTSSPRSSFFFSHVSSIHHGSPHSEGPLHSIRRTLCMDLCANATLPSFSYLFHSFPTSMYAWYPDYLVTTAHDPHDLSRSPPLSSKKIVAIPHISFIILWPYGTPSHTNNNKSKR